MIKVMFLVSCLLSLGAMPNDQRKQLLYFTIASPHKETIYNWYGGMMHHTFRYDGKEFSVQPDGSYLDETDNDQKDQLFIKLAEDWYREFGKLLTKVK